MVNPKAAGVAIGSILAFDSFFHVFWPAIGINFLVWNLEVYEIFIAWAPGVALTIVGAVVAAIYAFLWGLLLGYIFALIYNAVERSDKRRKK